MFTYPLHSAIASSTTLGDLVSWISADEASGNRADSHGSNTFLDNGSVGSATGKVSNSAQLTTGANWLHVAFPHGMHGGMRDWTAALWFYADALSGNTVVAACGGSSGTGTTLNWMFQLQGTALWWHVGLGTTPLGSVEASTFGALSINTWYLAIASHEETTDEIAISINNGTVDTGTANISANSSESVFIGKWGNLSQNRYYPGRVDEFAFWNRLLTTDEKTEIWNAGSGIGYPE